MATNEFTFNPGNILKPAQPSPLNRTAPVKLGVSLTLAAGQALGRKTTDDLFYALNTGASDGTQTFAGFLQEATATDASGNHYPQTGSGAGATSPYTPATGYTTAYTGGVFDPADVITNATATAAVITFTPATVAIGDIFTLRLAVAGVVTSVSFTATAATAANAAAGLVAAWNANATAAAVATATGTVTVILTATATNSPVNVSGVVSGTTGTLSKVLTTPSQGRAIADILAGSPGARVLQPYGFWEVP